MRKLFYFLMMGVILFSLTGCELTLRNQIIGTWEWEQDFDGVKYQEILSLTKDKKFSYTLKVDGAVQKTDSGDFSVASKVVDGKLHNTLTLGKDSVGIVVDENSSTGKITLIKETYGDLFGTEYFKQKDSEESSSDQ